MTMIVVQYRMSPRGQWWQDTYESVPFSDYEGYEYMPGDEIAVDYRYDHSSRGTLRIIQFTFDAVEDEYWTGAPTYRRQLIDQRFVKRYTKEHSVRVSAGSEQLFSLVQG
jgi:hypothetical protein